MENLETFEITTPINKAKVVIRKWMNGAQKRKIDSTLMASQSISIEDAKSKKVVDKIGVTEFQNYTDEMIKQLVVSVNGKTENVFELVTALHFKDVDEVSKAVSAVYSDKDFLAESNKS
jgi:hypothetical protein